MFLFLSLYVIYLVKNTVLVKYIRGRQRNICLKSFKSYYRSSKIFRLWSSVALSKKNLFENSVKVNNNSKELPEETVSSSY